MPSNYFNASRSEYGTIRESMVDGCGDDDVEDEEINSGIPLSCSIFLVHCPWLACSCSSLESFPWMFCFPLFLSVHSADLLPWLVWQLVWLTTRYPRCIHRRNHGQNTPHRDQARIKHVSSTPSPLHSLIWKCMRAR